MKLTGQKVVSTVEPVEIDIQTPFFSRKGDSYFAIEESEDDGPYVVQVFLGYNNLYNSIEFINESYKGFNKIAEDAINAEPITEDEFLSALSKVIPKYKDSELIPLKTAI